MYYHFKGLKNCGVNTCFSKTGIRCTRSCPLLFVFYKLCLSFDFTLSFWTDRQINAHIFSCSLDPLCRCLLSSSADLLESQDKSHSQRHQPPLTEPLLQCAHWLSCWCCHMLHHHSQGSCPLNTDYKRYEKACINLQRLKLLEVLQNWRKQKVSKLNGAIMIFWFCRVG